MIWTERAMYVTYLIPVTGPVVLKRGEAGGRGHRVKNEGPKGQQDIFCLNKSRVRTSNSLFASPSLDLSFTGAKFSLARGDSQISFQRVATQGDLVYRQ